MKFSQDRSPKVCLQALPALRTGESAKDLPSASPTIRRVRSHLRKESGKTSRTRGAGPMRKMNRFSTMAEAISKPDCGRPLVGNLLAFRGYRWMIRYWRAACRSWILNFGMTIERHKRYTLLPRTLRLFSLVSKQVGSDTPCIYSSAYFLSAWHISC